MRKTICLGMLLAAAFTFCVGAVTAQASEFDDPLFLFRPLRPEDPEAVREPPPVGDFEGPCGLAVNSAANFFVSDYHHHAVDFFGPSKGYGGQIKEPEPLLDPEEDPVDGPCGLAFDAEDNLYVNIYHRGVVKFANGYAGAGTPITGATVDGTHPTGVAVNQATGTLYVNDRTRIDSFDSAGAPLGPIGAGIIGDGYGLGISRYPATDGYLYVPDASTQTVRVFDPSTSTVNPVATIDGHATPSGHFVSLRDSAVAVDAVTGEVYIADDLQPEDTERPETAIYVFTAAGAYEGRLKYNVVNAWPTGLAVDNSANPSQGRVYVTTENSERAAIFAYPPHAATSVALPALPLPLQQQGEIIEEPWAGEEESGTEASRGEADAPAAAPLAIADAVPAAEQSKPRRARHRHGTRKKPGRSAGNGHGKMNRGDR